jgi:hypothetical protein
LKYPSGRNRGKIVLSQVNPIGMGGEAKINAVVDDQPCPASRDPAQLAGTAQEASGVGRLVAKLDERGAPSQQLFGKQYRSGDGIGR